jgi:hypothetical protein
MHDDVIITTVTVIIIAAILLRHATVVNAPGDGNIMALPNNPTPADWVAFLQRNDEAYGEIFLREGHCAGMKNLIVMNAAEKNTSLRTVEVDVSTLNEENADVISCMLRRLRYVNSLRFTGREADYETVVDKLLDGISKGASTVKDLHFMASGGPATFLDVAMRFQSSINFLSFGFPSTPICLSDDFATAVVVAIERGYLPSLQHFHLHCREPLPSTSRLVSSLRCRKVKLWACYFAVSVRNQGILRDVSALCLLTETVACVTIYRVRGLDGEIDAGAFLCLGATPELGFSQSVTNVVLEGICLQPPPGISSSCWTGKAGKALRNVQRLGLRSCRIPEISVLLRELRSLQALTILDRKDYQHLEKNRESEDIFNYVLLNSPTLLKTNNDLDGLALALASPESSVENLEVDLVSTNQSAFPAVRSLLRSSKGALWVSFGKLPWVGAEHVRAGLADLRSSLKRLGLRFFDCEFGDEDFESILRQFIPNRSLSELELGIKGNASLGELPLSAGAIGSILSSNRTLQRLSVRGHGLVAFQKRVLENVIAALSTDNRTLTCLNVRPMALDDDLRALLPQIREMLVLNDVFHTLHGFPFPEDDPLSIEVQHLLKLNRYGRRFLVRPALWPQCHNPALWTSILAKVARSGGGNRAVTFHFLRNKPSPVGAAEPAAPRRGAKRARPSDENQG